MNNLLDLVNHPGFPPAFSSFLGMLLLKKGVLDQNSTWESLAIGLVGDFLNSDDPAMIPEELAREIPRELKIEIINRVFVPALENTPPQAGKSLGDHLTRFIENLVKEVQELDGAKEALSAYSIPHFLDFDALLNEHVAH